MKTLLLFIPLLLAFGPFDSPKGIVEEGNALFEEGKYEEALERYDRALPLAKGKGAVEYNRANTLLKKGDIDGALKGYEESIAGGGSELRGRSFYNMGNLLFAAEKFGEAAEAFKEALKNDPADEDAKVNLELALRRMEEQQKQDKDGDEKEKKGENKKDEGGEDKQQGKEGQDKEEGKGGDKGDEEKQGEKKGEENKPRPENDEGEEKQARGNEMTKEEAERLLENLGDRNMDLQNMANMVQKADPVRVEKDW